MIQQMQKATMVLIGFTLQPHQQFQHNIILNLIIKTKNKNLTKEEILRIINASHNCRDKKDLIISIVTEHDMRLNSIIDAIHSRMIKQGLDPRCLDESRAHYPSGMVIKKEIKTM